MPLRGGKPGMRIKINPRNRYDLSHLTAEEANQTLKHIMEDLCFWGNLPLPLLPSRSRTANDRGNPYYYHSHYNEGLIRQQSSGSDGKSHNKKKKKDSSRTSQQQQRPPRGQGRVWKTAVDPSTGQTYYYDPVSRQTQWEKVRASWLAREMSVAFVMEGCF